MTYVDNRSFTTGFIIGIVIGVVVGIFTGIKIYENKMIKDGIMQYHPTTGEVVIKIPDK